MKLHWLVPLVAGLALIATAAPMAHPYPRPAEYPFRNNLEARLDWQKKAMAHAHRDIREIKSNLVVLTDEGAKRSRVAELNVERGFVRTLTRELGETRKAIRLARKVALANAAAGAVAYGSGYSTPVYGPTSVNWICIHNHEGSWTDPNAPYYGGLQMGDWFMETYAPDLLAVKGTADHWTAEEQIAVAEAAWDSSGHSIGWLNGQWPNSSRACGYNS